MSVCRSAWLVFIPARKYLGWESIIRVKLELISFFSAGVGEVGKKDPRLLYKATSHPTGAPQTDYDVIIIA